MVDRRKHRQDPNVTQFARNQRRTANEFAMDVWQMVRGRHCCGVKFRREYPIEHYVVDFCCVELRLVVEVDGAHHFTQEGMAADRERDSHLRRLGYSVLRIPGYDVVREPAAVRERIVAAIRDLLEPPHPQPLSPKS